MKKTNILFACAIALLGMSSCNNDSAAVTPSIEGITEDIDTGRVEIAFGSTTATTRADATLTNIDEIPLGQVGVYGVARSATDLNMSPGPIKWFPTDPIPAGQQTCCVLKNTEAGRFQRTDGTGAYELLFDKKYYYPITNFYRYEFFAYHPRVDNSAVTYSSSDEVTAWFNVNGYTDVLWGHLYSDETDAFSAKWVRNRRSAGLDTIPELKLYHQLLRLEFFATPGSPEEIRDLGNVAVKSIQVIETPTRMRMKLLAHDWDETKYAQILQKTQLGTVTVYEDGRTFGELQPVPIPLTMGQEVRVGSDIMLIPMNTYTLRIVLQRDLGNGQIEEFQSEYPLQIGQGNGNPNLSTELQAGYTYRVRLRVHTPVKIELNSTIEDWETDPENNPYIYL